MAALTVSASPPDNLSISFSLPPGILLEHILGVALFDVNGLPKAYFTTAAHPSTGWVQMVFQALGLRSLVASSLKLEGFHYTLIALSGSTAVVIRRRQDYVALLLTTPVAHQFQDDPGPLTQWVNALPPDFFEKHPHFTVA